MGKLIFRNLFNDLLLSARHRFQNKGNSEFLIVVFGAEQRRLEFELFVERKESIELHTVEVEFVQVGVIPES